MSNLVRPYRGVSAADRTQQRRGQLLDACLDVVGQLGVAEATVELICKRAGLSKRYFYESFADREAILGAALERVIDDVRNALTGTPRETPVDPTEQMRRLVSVTVTTITADPRVARLWAEAGHQPVLEERRSRAYGDVAQLLLDIVLPGDGTGDPGARSAFILIVAGTTEVLRRWIADEPERPAEEIVDAITRVGLAVRAAFMNGTSVDDRRSGAVT